MSSGRMIVITPGNELDKDRWRELRARARTLGALVRALPPNGAAIHNRMQALNTIEATVSTIDEQGECRFSWCDGTRDSWYTLDTLERYLEYAEKKLLGNKDRRADNG